MEKESRRALPLDVLFPPEGGVDLKLIAMYDLMGMRDMLKEQALNPYTYSQAREQKIARIEAEIQRRLDAV